MIRAILMLLSLAGCSVGGGSAAPPASAPCPAGEVVVHGDDPTTCDLIGGINTLTIVDITEAACDGAGGRWWYEACVNADF